MEFWVQIQISSASHEVLTNYLLAILSQVYTTTQMRRLPVVQKPHREEGRHVWDEQHRIGTDIQARSQDGMVKVVSQGEGDVPEKGPGRPGQMNVLISCVRRSDVVEGAGMT